MLHNLAARAILMSNDFGISMLDSIMWVTHRMPASLKSYYIRALVIETTQAVAH